MADKKPTKKIVKKVARADLAVLWILQSLHVRRHFRYLSNCLKNDRQIVERPHIVRG